MGVYVYIAVSIHVYIYIFTHTHCAELYHVAQLAGWQGEVRTYRKGLAKQFRIDLMKVNCFRGRLCLHVSVTHLPRSVTSPGHNLGVDCSKTHCPCGHCFPFYLWVAGCSLHGLGCSTCKSVAGSIYLRTACCVVRLEALVPQPSFAWCSLPQCPNIYLAHNLGSQTGPGIYTI